MQIGILSTGVYLPDEFITGTEIAKLAGIPTQVVEEKMGIKKKHVPGQEDHTCAMGIIAAKKAIAKAGIDPLEIDLVIYIGEEHKEYPLWTAGIKLQEEIGAFNAWAFDVALRCSTTVMALKVAKSMMIADPDLKTVLLAGGYRNVDFIDYENPRTRFMFNLGAGGGAILLKKGHNENLLLETELMTDGSFSEDVVVVSGGTKNPISKEAIDQRLNKLDVLNPAGMKARLEEKSMANFLKVIRESVRKSGYREGDISYLAILHMKKSAHEYVLRELGLSDSQSIYLQDYGHIGQIDQILSLELAVNEGKVKDGDLVVLVSAGIGYAWGATTIKWGKGD
ncbi:3-oxoacyl-(acyl-carrier-protein) synthase, KASIII [Neobacillus massiliamazoniensis]|uniref:3-oxoacyl-(Acyl-carrier-protein) synthase, KASIII n=1 Tax=Neobacillus massiliamazoniensis TaxID=1499688 RepID=A0A0U1NUP0_9BACI|nr:3-oxoacyl-ACP synthase [Neobacillus massiliamazoniensis]CRK81733.1 3-oxoacyl-(acyl-carrier-protein) synthase, KASIII [Neobacillus massiliamazoniensis]